MILLLVLPLLLSRVGLGSGLGLELGIIIHILPPVSLLLLLLAITTAALGIRGPDILLFLYYTVYNRMRRLDIGLFQSIAYVLNTLCIHDCDGDCRSSVHGYSKGLVQKLRNIALGTRYSFVLHHNS